MRKSVLAGAMTPAFFLLIFLLLGVARPSAGWAAQPNLDERVADLETTVAHSGNRAFSLTIYGQVNRALLFWDDGRFGVDNHTLPSRLGFVGRAELRPGWIGGYRLELETAFPLSDDVFNGFNTSEDGILSLLQIRQNYWDITNKDGGAHRSRVSIACHGRHNDHQSGQPNE